MIVVKLTNQEAWAILNKLGAKDCSFSEARAYWKIYNALDEPADGKETT